MTHKNIWTINVALFGSLLFGTSFAALTDYDGKWNGLISCTANARDANDIPFSRNNIYSIHDGRISASYSTRGGKNQLMAEGTVNNASASMTIKRSDTNNQWATNLKSVSIVDDKIVLTGEAVQRGVKLRDCTMELTVVEPAVNSLASKNRNAQLAQTAKAEAEAAAKAAAQKEAAAKVAAQKEAAAKEAAAKAAAQKEAAEREAAAGAGREGGVRVDSVEGAPLVSVRSTSGSPDMTRTNRSSDTRFLIPALPSRSPDTEFRHTESGSSAGSSISRGSRGVAAAPGPQVERFQVTALLGKQMIVDSLFKQIARF
jgi:ribosomal protein L14E/L6E/L27E